MQDKLGQLTIADDVRHLLRFMNTFLCIMLFGSSLKIKLETTAYGRCGLYIFIEEQCFLLLYW